MITQNFRWNGGCTDDDMRSSSLRLALGLSLAACSGPIETYPSGPTYSNPKPPAAGAPSGAPTSAPPTRDAGTPTQAPTPNPTTPTPVPTSNTPPTSGPGTGGTGGSGPGDYDITLAGTQVAMHVPSGSGPQPLILILHGQGDTGRNFLNVWSAKGLPTNVIVAAPDDNTDTTAAAVEDSLRSLYDIDTANEYVVGFSQGGGYAAFILFDANAAQRFRGIVLASSGLAEDPSYIPQASAHSPKIAVVIDPNDPNNTWNQGLHVMEDFVGLMAQKGYASKLLTHSSGHTLEPTQTSAALSWMFSSP